MNEDYLVDTSMLMRIVNAADPQNATASLAIAELHRRGERLRVTAQNFIEFRNGATRPVLQNGLGWTSAAADAQLDAFEKYFPLVPETPAIYPAWKDLVKKAGVIGKQVHDARLVAICHVNNISHILTFNIQHFTRFIPYNPGITVIDPRTV